MAWLCDEGVHARLGCPDFLLSALVRTVCLQDSIRSPIRLYPPHCLAGENAAHSINQSTVSVILEELWRAKLAVRRFLDSLPPREQLSLSLLSPSADALWEALFDPVDFFREPRDAVFLGFDLTFEPDDGLEVVGEVDGASSARGSTRRGGKPRHAGVHQLCVDSDSEDCESEDVDGCASLAPDDDGGSLQLPGVRFGSVSEVGPGSVVSMGHDEAGTGLPRMPRSPRSVSSECSEGTSASRAGANRKKPTEFDVVQLDDRGSIVDPYAQDELDDDDHAVEADEVGSAMGRDGEAGSVLDGFYRDRDYGDGHGGHGIGKPPVSGKTSVVTDADATSHVSGGGWTVLSYEPVLRQPPGVLVSLRRRRQWYEDIFSVWVALVERNILPFCRDVERLLVPLKARLKARQHKRDHRDPVRTRPRVCARMHFDGDVCVVERGVLFCVLRFSSAVYRGAAASPGGAHHVIGTVRLVFLGEDHRHFTRLVDGIGRHRGRGAVPQRQHRDV